MKLVISHSFSRRPFSTLLFSLLAITIIGFVLVSLDLQLISSPFGTTLFLLIKAGFKLIPPVMWFGGVLLVAFWLAVVARLLRRPVEEGLL